MIYISGCGIAAAATLPVLDVYSSIGFRLIPTRQNMSPDVTLGTGVHTA